MQATEPRPAATPDTLKCRVCGSADAHTTYSLRETMYGWDETFRYFECRHCGCLQIAEIPADLSRYYPQEYSVMENVESAYLGSPVKRLVAPFMTRQLARYAISGKGFIGQILYQRYPITGLKALRHTTLSKHSRVLDVGCGSGKLPWVMTESGFRNVLGVDPFVDADIHYRNGLRIRKADLGDLEGHWDIIMFNHSFEHVPNPKEVLEQARERLAPDGTCILRVPTVDSHAWRHYRANWGQLDAPRHLHLFSIRSLELLADQVGLRVRDVHYDSTDFQFLASAAVQKGEPLSRSALKRSWADVFPWSQRARGRRRASALNESREGDQISAQLTHK